MSRYKLIHIISSLQRGGAENLLASLLKNMPEFEHHVFFIHDGPIRKNIESYGIKTYHIKKSLWPYDPWSIYRLYKHIKNLQADCIITSLWAANFIGRLLKPLLKIPVINTVHMGGNQEGRLRLFLDKVFFTKPSYYIAVSLHVKQSLIDLRKIAPHDIIVIPNGIEPTQLSAKMEEQNSVFVFGTVGRMVRLKNFDLLLKAFAVLQKKYTNIELLIIGTGAEEVNLKRLAVDLGIADNVQFIINQPAYNYYQFFDCFVQPSAYEGGSVALLEAMCAELTVITTHNGIVHPVIKHKENGYLIDKPDIQGLVAAMEELMRDKRLRQQLSSNAKKTIQDNYLITQTASKYHNLITKVILSCKKNM